MSPQQPIKFKKYNPKTHCIMKSSLQNNIQEPHLKVIKSTKRKKPVKRIYINTLVPGFSYLNSLGEAIMPRNCALL